MDKDKIKQILNNQHIIDYSSAILFFIISSLFAFFVIRPVLTVAVKLDKEAKDLVEINAVYDKNINQINILQNDLALVAQDRYLLDQALPQDPNTKDLINDINFAAQNSGVNLEELVVSEIAIDEVNSQPGQVRDMTVNIRAKGNFLQLNNIINYLLSQKRLKKINNLRISKQQLEGSNDVILSISAIIKSNYIISKI